MTFLKKVKDFLVFIRWFHSLLALFPFVSIFLLMSFDIGLQSNEVSTADFFLMCAAVEAILVSGVILNDLVDTGIDRINKSEKRSIGRTITYTSAKNYFLVFSILSIALSIYITIFAFHYRIWFGMGEYFLSVLYNVYLKRLPLIGNVAMALLAAFVPLMIPVFMGDIISQLENDRIEVLIYVYASLVFLITVPRELTLDISDKLGDEAFGFKTLPILIGSRKSKYVVSFFILTTIALNFWAMYHYAHLRFPLIIMDLGFVYFLYHLPKTHTRSGYVKICRQLWLSMIIGMIGSTITTLF